MGFKRPERTILLKFEGDWEGAEVRCRRSVSTRFALDFAGFEALSSSEQKALMASFAEQVLMEWNLEDDAGAPIPATPDAFLDQETEFTGLIMRKWSEVISNVPKVSAVPSLNGSTLAEPFVATGA